MDLDKDFADWWLHTGKGIAADIVNSEKLENQLESTRLLCRIAYCQGRIDECTRVEEQLEEKLAQ